METDAKTMMKKVPDCYQRSFICNVAQYFHLGMPLTLSIIQLANHIYLMSVMVNERDMTSALTEFTSSREDMLNRFFKCDEFIKWGPNLSGGVIEGSPIEVWYQPET